MSFNEFKDIRKASDYYFVKFFPRVLRFGKGFQLEALGLFKRNFESQRDIVGYVYAPYRKYFQGNRYVVFYHDDGNGFRADIRQDATGDFLRFGKTDEAGRERRGHYVQNFNSGLLHGFHEIVYVLFKAHYEQSFDFKLAAFHSDRPSQNFFPVNFV